MTNMKLADELFTIRQEIKRLQGREAEIKDAIETGQAANAIRMAEAETRRAKTAEAVLALLQAGPCSRVQIQERLHLTEAIARNALTRLRDDGLASFRKGAGNVAIWRAL